MIEARGIRRDDAAAVADEIRAALPDGVGVAALDAAVAREGLIGAEHAATPGMIERRRREFTGGRAAARAAMAELGLPPAPIPMGRDRAPRWPGGVVGSISHSARVCAAIAARDGAVASLGLDVEADRPLAPALIRVCCGPHERAWLDEQPEAERGRLGMLIFSAKECAYKCQYPLTGRMLGFDAFRIEVDRSVAGFRAVFTAAVGLFAPGEALPGHWAFRGGHAITTIALPA